MIALSDQAFGPVSEVVGTVVAVTIAAFASWHFSHALYAQRRRRALVRFAAANGGFFRTSGVSDPGEAVRRLFAPLAAQPLGAIRHVVRVGDLRAFDQVSPRGPLLPRRWRTFVLLPTGIDIGRVVVEPEGVAERLAEKLGLGDIDFESAEFSSQYRVVGERRDLVYALFHADMIELMLGKRGCWIMLAPGWALFLSGSLLEPARIGAMFGIARSFGALIPRHLREDYPAS